MFVVANNFYVFTKITFQDKISFRIVMLSGYNKICFCIGLNGLLVSAGKSGAGSNTLINGTSSHDEWITDPDEWRLKYG